ncbi:MAG: 1-deoxy-D-xylulose-5-phosphate reductoisomerase, partial [Gemmatimonadota bacterium]|nr:1-deoxy-D-xylulose-5-phosphate reductoisomerase [Gemmatimonadota bacterium]
MNNQESPLGVAILGSTGSIGTSALNLLQRHPQKFQLRALTAGSNAELLRAQILQWQPAFSGLVEGVAGDGWSIGSECLVQAATRADVDIVLNAVVGAAGLPATLAALTAGKRVALANKESLVIAGDMVMRAAREHGGCLFPVDSEHSAIMQC